MKNSQETSPQTTTQDATWQEILTPEYIPRIATMAMAIWLHAANSMLTATTMPSAVEEIGGLHLINWTFALYLMGSIIAGASISLSVVKFGLRKTMIYSSLLYAIGCAVCALAPTIEVVLIGRTIQGLGGGALVALVYVSQDRFFPNRFVPKVVACLSMVWMISAFCGPVIGGAFATFGSWRMAFWTFALQGLLLPLAIHYLLKSETHQTRGGAERIPFVRLTLLAAVILLISQSGAHFDPLFSPLYILLGCAALYAFIVWDKRASQSRMLPEGITDLGLPMCNGILMTFTLCITIMSFLVYGPFILIEYYGLTPLGAGFVVMLETFAWGTAAIVLSGTRSESEPHLIRTCSALVVLGIVALAWLLANGPLWSIVIAVLVSNGSFGAMWGFVIKRIVAATPESEKARAASIIPATQQLGFALGAALSGLIANGLGLSESMGDDGIRVVAFWLFAGFIPIALLGNVMAWRFVRTRL